MTAFNKSPEGGFAQVQLPVVVGACWAAPSGCRGKIGSRQATAHPVASRFGRASLGRDGQGCGM